VCDTYTLELFGLPCPLPTLHIAGDATPDNVLLQWSSAYPDYRLRFVDFLDGPGPIPFAPVPSAPVLINGKFSVANAATGSHRFFRLEAPLEP
jgi:hypothetical protein